VSVLFATKTWEGDYNQFLKNAFKNKWKPFGYQFDAKWLLVNNGVPKETYYYLKADQKVDVSEYEDIVLKHFKLKKRDFEGGYVYSIGELTAIFLASRFDYLCWVQGDCLLKDAKGFVEKAIAILENNPHILVVSPLSEVNTWHNDKGLDHFFSDQCFFIKVSEFNKPIYHYKKPELTEYPTHGGNSFERMVGRYLHKTKKFRKILTDYYLIHEAY